MLVQAHHNKEQNIRQKARIRTLNLKGDVGLKDAYKMNVQTRLAGPDDITCDKLKNNLKQRMSEETRTRNWLLAEEVHSAEKHKKAAEELS